MVKRKTYKFRGNTIIEVEEYPDGNYGAPGEKRQKRQNLTTEQMARKNRMQREKKARHRMLQYFSLNDLFVTLTYKPEERPPDMKAAQKDFDLLRRKLVRHYRKKEKTLYWMNNIERGTKGAWHIHLLITNLEGTLELIEDIWKKGGIYAEKIYKSKFGSPDFRALAAYMTKDEIPTEKKKDGTMQKPRVKEAKASHSRNMPLKPPKVEKLKRWKQKPWIKKGYELIQESFLEGMNPFGIFYRRYTMVMRN